MHGHVRPFQRLEPADEQDDRSVCRQADGTAGAAPIAGGEEGVLDGRRHRLDHAVRVAVQTAELAFLLRTADANRIATTDHLGLGAVTPIRFEVAALGLDPGQGVERRHQRHVEAVLEAMAGDPTQPVVAVDQVDAPARLDVVPDPVGEHVDLLGERLFGEVERSGGHVNHGVSRLDDQLTRQAGPIGTGVRRARHAGLGECRGDLAHVDVHASAVAGTRLDERGRVKGDQCDPRHDNVKHY